MDPGKIKLDNFDPEIKKWIIDFKKILEEQNQENAKNHYELTKNAPTGPMDKLYFRYPSLFSLLIYEKEGLDFIFDYLISKTTLFGINILLAIILKKNNYILDILENAKSYLGFDIYKRTINKIEKIIEKPEIIKYSKNILFNIIQYFISNDISRIEEIFSGGKIILNDENEYKFLMNLIIQTTLKINDKTCVDLESLLKKDLPEKQFQKFFEKHPEILDPLATEVIKKQDFGKEFFSDFVIRRLDDQYIFIEIEKPSKQLFTKKLYPTQKLSQPIGQILNWFVWIEDNINYAQSHGFPNIHSPKGVIVIGRKNKLTEKENRQLKILNDIYYPKIEILTYDDVLKNARNIIKNLLDRI